MTTIDGCTNDQCCWTPRKTADLFSDDYFISKNDPVGFYKSGAANSPVQWLLRDPAYDELVSKGRAALEDAERVTIAVDVAKCWNDASRGSRCAQGSAPWPVRGGQT